MIDGKCFIHDPIFIRCLPADLLVYQLKLILFSSDLLELLAGRVKWIQHNLKHLVDHLRHHLAYLLVGRADVGI